MAKIVSIKNKTPQIASCVWLAENATIVGDVQIGSQSSIWFNAVVRGDVNHIKIGERVNIQDLVLIHCTYKKTKTTVENDVTIGHSAILHGCTVEEKALIGMGAIVLDNAHIGKGALIAAGAIVKEGTQVPPYTLWAGMPAKQVKELDKKTVDVKRLEMANNYIKYSGWYK